MAMVMGGGAVAAEPATRTLPIRGQALLDAMRTTPLPPLPREVHLSPDGGKLLYAEAVYPPPYGVGYVDHLGEQPKWTLWMHDLATGKRIALQWPTAGPAEAELQAFRMGRRLAPRWSADGRQVALLEQRPEQRVLWVFASDGGELMGRHALPDAPAGVATAESVVDWRWCAESGEVVLGLEPGTSGYQPYARPKQDGIRWDWIMSRDQRDADAIRDAVPARAIRIVEMDLDRGTTVERRPRAAGAGFRIERERGSDPWYPGPLNWQFDTADRVLVGMRDPRLAQWDDGEFRWRLDAGEPTALALQDAHSTVYAFDVKTGAVRNALRLGSGRVASVTRDADGESLVVVQGTPATANWPMEGAWGELSWRRPDGRDGSAAAVVSAASRVFASDRAGTVYHYDPLLLQLTEISSTGAKAPLGLPGLSITHCDVSADGRRIAAVFEGANTPPQVQVWDVDARAWQAVARPGAQWRNPAGITVEHLTWRSGDDVFDVDGFLIKPADFDPARRYPMLVLLKGGHTMRTVRFADRFDPMLGGGRGVGGPPAAIYAQAGYLVFMPNHRGSEGAGVAANRAHVGHYGAHVERDVFTGIDRLVDKGWVDPQRLGVIGHSHGGDEAYYAIAHSHRFKAALINDSHVPMPEFFVPNYESGRSVLRRTYGQDIMTRMLGADPVRQPWANPDDIRTPLLLRWAARRGPNALERLDFDNGWAMSGMVMTHRMVHALRSHDVPVEVIIDQDDHQVENPHYMLEWQSRLLQWFDYFVQDKGPNPQPAMESPFDYTEDLRKIEAAAAPLSQ